MFPGYMGWWKKKVEAHCAAHADCGPSGWGWRHRGHAGESGHDDARWASGDDGSAFGVRRPLRFMAHKLDLDDEQVASLARILDELKIERAQAAVDNRRTVSSFADALAQSTFDAASVAAAAGERVKSAERLRDAVVQALSKVHAMLSEEQRAKLAYLLRTGVLTI